MERFLVKNYDMCLDRARKYGSYTEWQTAVGSYYGTACKNGWHRKIASQLGWKVRTAKSRTYSECLREARGYVSSIDWSQRNGASYKYASRKGWLDAISRELGW